jgi:hypothetical protein
VIERHGGQPYCAPHPRQARAPEVEGRSTVTRDTGLKGGFSNAGGVTTDFSTWPEPWTPSWSRLPRPSGAPVWAPRRRACLVGQPGVPGSNGGRPWPTRRTHNTKARGGCSPGHQLVTRHGLLDRVWLFERLQPGARASGAATSALMECQGVAAVAGSGPLHVFSGLGFRQRAISIRSHARQPFHTAPARARRPPSTRNAAKTVPVLANTLCSAQAPKRFTA